MNADDLKLHLGSMIRANEFPEVEDGDDAKEHFDDLAAGRTLRELTGAEIKYLQCATRLLHGADRLNAETARLLDLDTKATYADAMFHCRLAANKDFVTAGTLD
jgi:hypothetical protein